MTEEFFIKIFSAFLTATVFYIILITTKLFKKQKEGEEDDKI